MSRTPKQRLDLLLVERDLADSREQARRLIMAGEILIDEVVYDKPGRQIPVDANIRVRNPLPYVSRGGQKLAAALQQFDVTVQGATAIDVGASTGGFTDCLLQHGADRVYAIDVGYGQLAWKLRNDPRVIVLERTNIRYLDALPNGDMADLAVIDASFISLALVLSPTIRLLRAGSPIIALIKPQFEAGRQDVGKGGVVRDRETHRRVIHDVIQLAVAHGYHSTNLLPSPLLGPAGNVEFLIHLSTTPASDTAADTLVENALLAAEELRKTAV